MGLIHSHAIKFFHDGGPYHIETSPLICSANQWTGFYIYNNDPRHERVNRIFTEYYIIENVNINLRLLFCYISPKGSL